jgi:hypothetical protein
MGASKQIKGMQGVYLAAAELSRLGFIVATTSRGARGADLLVTDEGCRTAWTVQVKTNTSGSSYWLVGKEAAAKPGPHHVFVFVEVPPSAVTPAAYFVVPGEELASLVCVEEFGGTPWYSFEREKAEGYRDNWRVFESEGSAGTV